MNSVSEKEKCNAKEDGCQLNGELSSRIPQQLVLGKDNVKSFINWLQNKCRINSLYLEQGMCFFLH